MLRTMKRLAALTTAALLVTTALAATAASAAPEAGGQAADRAAKTTLVASWYSGTLAAGATQNWQWNNNPAGAVYQVGLSPTGASTSQPCQFQVTRSWYTQLYSGERRFNWTIRNTGAIACGTQVMLSSLTSGATWALGGIAPGGSVTSVWNNNPANVAYLPGIAPSGATSTTGCQLEVTSSWYSRQTNGERRFYFTVKNVGTITCAGSALLGSTSTSTTWSAGTLAPSATSGSVWYNANPTTLVYLPGLNPAVAASTCQFGITSSYYQQVVNSDGTVQRQYLAYYTNVGGVTCSATFLLGSIT
ncbi:hypothetical protein OG271_18610 [Micromonospora rifamycinica]|uniref:hypothetical protein n=1 Tax=Micromonospora rifamycinica TaxID=291594 RepID=UPI002E2C9D16|nr:hypothetical protein [Micromonospora rifamycinica]